MDTSDEWIVSRTGIRERRWLAADRATSEMCAAAGRSALAAAGSTAEDVDVIIVATYTHDQPLPSTALIVKETLGAHRALPLDVNQAACVNGVQAMLLGAHLLQTTADTVLVIAADCASRVTDPQDRTTRVFFGDAVAAVVLTRPSRPGVGLLGWDFGTELSYGVQIPAGGSRLPTTAQTVADRQHYLEMNGRRCGTPRPGACLRAFSTPSTASAGDITHFFLHQAT